MIKRVLLGIVWFFVIYVAVCAVTGGIAGGMAGAKDPKHGSEAGAKAGAEAVERLGGYLLAGSLLLAVAGTWAGVLPGTRSKVVERPVV